MEYCASDSDSVETVLTKSHKGSRAPQTQRCCQADRSSSHPIARFCLLLMAFSSSLVLIGCNSVPKPQLPNPPPVYTSVEYTNPNSDAQCGCRNSRGAYAKNTATTEQSFSWTVYAKDTSSGQNINPQPGTQLLPKRNPDGTPSATFLGCTIYEPSSAPTCKFAATYIKTSSPTPKLIQPGGSITAIFGTTTPSISSCKAWCAAPNDPTSGPCLPLGVRYFPVVAPLTTLLDRVETNGGLLKKDELLRDYQKTSADDKCSRRDVELQSGHLVNEGTGSPTEFCKVASKDLDVQVTQSLKAKGYPISGTSSMAMNGFIPYRVEATPLKAIAGLTNGRIVQFEVEATAPIINFEGTGGDALTAAFGGVVMASTRVSLISGKSQVIVATTNGCISVEEP